MARNDAPPDRRDAIFDYHDQEVRFNWLRGYCLAFDKVCSQLDLGENVSDGLSESHFELTGWLVLRKWPGSVFNIGENEPISSLDAFVREIETPKIVPKAVRPGLLSTGTLLLLILGPCRLTTIETTSSSTGA